MLLQSLKNKCFALYSSTTAVEVQVEINIQWSTYSDHIMINNSTKTSLYKPKWMEKCKSFATKSCEAMELCKEKWQYHLLLLLLICCFTRPNCGKTNVSNNKMWPNSAEEKERKILKKIARALFYLYFSTNNVSVCTVVTHRLGRCFVNTDTHFSH